MNLMKHKFVAIGAVLFALASSPVLANKVGAALSGVKSIGSIGNNADQPLSGQNPCDPDSFDSNGIYVCDEPNDTGWKKILEVDIQTQNHAEMAFDMALQCGVTTDTTVKSKGGNNDGATAQAGVNVRIKVTYENGEVAYALPGNKDDGVTYCSREQTLEAKFAGLECTADSDGIVTCASEEELRLLISTLNANAFNYIITGVPVGTHHVEVQARAKTATGTFGTALGSASAEAFIGMGSLFVDEVQLINGWGFIE